jgi:hypothetical protein
MEVPTYGDTKVSQAAFPNARFNAEAPVESFGGGAAQAPIVQGVKGVADVVSEIASKERVKAIDTMTQEGLAQIVTEKNRLVYDPKDGALTKRGKDAFTTPEDYGKRFDDFSSKVESAMPDPEAKQMFRKMRLRERSELDGVLGRHVSQESERLQDETFKGLVSAMTDDAIANFDQRPGKIGDNLKIMKAAANQRLDDMGIVGNDEQTQATRNEFLKSITNKVHIGVINRMVSMDERDTARAYFNANKSQISGMDMDMLEKEIKTTDLLKQKDAYLSAAALLDKAGKGAVPAAVVPGFDALTGEQRAALGRRFSNEQSATAHHEFYALSQAQIADLDRAEFETKYWSRFDADHRRAADAYWQAAFTAQRDGKDGAFKSIRGDKDMILTALRKGKLVSSSGELKGDEAETAQRFEDYVDDKFKTFTHENKRNPKDEEKQAIIHRAMIDTVFVEEWGTDPQKPRGILSEDDIRKSYLPLTSIKRSDRLLLINLARSQQIIKPEGIGGPNDDRAIVMLQGRIERAYAAAAGGANRTQIIAIMKGE